MNNDIDKIQDDIIKEFSDLDDWFDKYEHIISLGKNLEPLDDKFKTDQNSVGGCQAKVWVKAEIVDDKIKYIADSDSAIVKGLISLLLKVLNNQHPKDVVDTDLYFIKRIGLNSNLSPSRNNGLLLILKQIRFIAKDSV